MPEVTIYIHEGGYTYDIENPDGVKVIVRNFNVDPECFEEGETLPDGGVIYKDEDSEDGELYVERIH